MITTKDFEKQITNPFGKAMRASGFKGTGFKYFQETEDFLIAIYISPSRWGGSCSAGFAIHPKKIDKDYNNKKYDFKKLKINQYEFKTSLAEYARGEWWDYKDDEKENIETLSKIINSIKEKAFPIIKKFSSTPNILELFEVNELNNFHENWTKNTGVSISTTDLRFALVMTIFFETKDFEKAKQFAKWGLSHLTESEQDWFGKNDFDRVLGKKP